MVGYVGGHLPGLDGDRVLPFVRSLLMLFGPSGCPGLPSGDVASLPRTHTRALTAGATVLLKCLERGVPTALATATELRAGGGLETLALRLAVETDSHVRFGGVLAERSPPSATATATGCVRLLPSLPEHTRELVTCIFDILFEVIAPQDSENVGEMAASAGAGAALLRPLTAPCTCPAPTTAGSGAGAAPAGAPPPPPAPTPPPAAAAAPAAARQLLRGAALSPIAEGSGVEMEEEEGEGLLQGGGASAPTAPATAAAASSSSHSTSGGVGGGVAGGSPKAPAQLVSFALGRPWLVGLDDGIGEHSPADSPLVWALKDILTHPAAFGTAIQTLGMQILADCVHGDPSLATVCWDCGLTPIYLRALLRVNGPYAHTASPSLVAAPSCLSELLISESVKERAVVYHKLWLELMAMEAMVEDKCRLAGGMGHGGSTVAGAVAAAMEFVIGGEDTEGASNLAVWGSARGPEPAAAAAAGSAASGGDAGGGEAGASPASSSAAADATALTLQDSLPPLVAASPTSPQGQPSRVSANPSGEDTEMSGSIGLGPASPSSSSSSSSSILGVGSSGSGGSRGGQGGSGGASTQTGGAKAWAMPIFPAHYSAYHVMRDAVKALVSVGFPISPVPLAGGDGALFNRKLSAWYSSTLIAALMMRITGSVALQPLPPLLPCCPSDCSESSSSSSSSGSSSSSSSTNDAVAWERIEFEALFTNAKHPAASYYRHTLSEPERLPRKLFYNCDLHWFGRKVPRPVVSGEGLGESAALLAQGHLVPSWKASLGAPLALWPSRVKEPPSSSAILLPLEEVQAEEAQAMAGGGDGNSQRLLALLTQNLTAKVPENQFQSADPGSALTTFRKAIGGAPKYLAEQFGGITTIHPLEISSVGACRIDSNRSSSLGAAFSPSPFQEERVETLASSLILVRSTLLCAPPLSPSPPLAPLTIIRLGPSTASAGGALPPCDPTFTCPSWDTETYAPNSRYERVEKAGLVVAGADRKRVGELAKHCADLWECIPGAYGDLVASCRFFILAAAAALVRARRDHRQAVASLCSSSSSSSSVVASDTPRRLALLDTLLAARLDTLAQGVGYTSLLLRALFRVPMGGAPSPPSSNQSPLSPSGYVIGLSCASLWDNSLWKNLGENGSDELHFHNCEGMGGGSSFGVAYPQLHIWGWKPRVHPQVALSSTARAMGLPAAGAAAAAAAAGHEGAFAPGRDLLDGTLAHPFQAESCIANGLWAARCESHVRGKGDRWGGVPRGRLATGSPILRFRDLVALEACSSQGAAAPAAAAPLPLSPHASCYGAGVDDDAAMAAHCAAFTCAATLPDLLQLLLLSCAPPWRTLARDAEAAAASSHASEAYGEEGTLLLRNLNAGLWRPGWGGGGGAGCSGIAGAGPKLTPAAIEALVARGTEARLEAGKAEFRGCVLELLAMCIRHSPLVGMLEMASHLAADATAFYGGSSGGAWAAASAGSTASPACPLGGVAAFAAHCATFLHAAGGRHPSQFLEGGALGSLTAALLAVHFDATHGVPQESLLGAFSPAAAAASAGAPPPPASPRDFSQNQLAYIGSSPPAGARLCSPTFSFLEGSIALEVPAQELLARTLATVQGSFTMALNMGHFLQGITNRGWPMPPFLAASSKWVDMEKRGDTSTPRLEGFSDIDTPAGRAHHSYTWFSCVQGLLAAVLGSSGTCLTLAGISARALGAAHFHSPQQQQQQQRGAAGAGGMDEQVQPPTTRFLVPHASPLPGLLREALLGTSRNSLALLSALNASNLLPNAHTAPPLATPVGGAVDHCCNVSPPTGTPTPLYVTQLSPYADVFTQAAVDAIEALVALAEGEAAAACAAAGGGGRGGGLEAILELSTQSTMHDAAGAEGAAPCSSTQALTQGQLSHLAALTSFRGDVLRVVMRLLLGPRTASLEYEHLIAVRHGGASSGGGEGKGGHSANPSAEAAKAEIGCISRDPGYRTNTALLYAMLRCGLLERVVRLIGGVYEANLVAGALLPQAAAAAAASAVLGASFSPATPAELSQRLAPHLSPHGSAAAPAPPPAASTAMDQEEQGRLGGEAAWVDAPSCFALATALLRGSPTFPASGGGGGGGGGDDSGGAKGAAALLRAVQGCSAVVCTLLERLANPHYLLSSGFTLALARLGARYDKALALRCNTDPSSASTSCACAACGGGALQQGRIKHVL